jgi:hypothetical protein
MRKPRGSVRRDKPTGFSGPAEFSAISPDAVHDYGQPSRPARQSLFSSRVRAPKGLRAISVARNRLSVDPSG